MNSKRVIPLAVVIILILITVFIVFLPLINRNNQGNSGNQNPPPTPPTPSPQVYVPKDGKVEPALPLESQADWIIDITTAGFSPDNLKIKRGDSVIWTSRDRYASHQIVATGTNGGRYPERGDCGTKLDSCFALKLGESFRATLNSSGTWQYQDRLNAQFKGVIIVE